MNLTEFDMHKKYTKSMYVACITVTFTQIVWVWQQFGYVGFF